MNSVIDKTKFTTFNRYSTDIKDIIMKKSMLNELEQALTKLEGYSAQIKNCNCKQIYSCQSVSCQINAKFTGKVNWQSCQTPKDCNKIRSCQKVSCQYMTCQRTVCQQGTSCQTCQVCEYCQACETCESQCLCQTCQTCQDKTYDVWSCQEIKCQSCESCQIMLCETVSCQARKNVDGRDLE
jgi:hypothetical protein